ncbi:MAG: hydroxymethylbilane synthase [Chloroflexota bacterium]|nr:hydroxymethylbilane synthase [Chloroflexota bacterium]MDE2970029.1 hydroxymethylbilane synthase [Chloroflexota bacterium]
MSGLRSRIVVGTRGSPLALAQGQRAVDALQATYPDITVDVQVVTTTGDASQETPLSELGLGVFTKELEAALLDGRIDMAAHSLKDMSATGPEGLTIAAVLEREDPCDVLVSRSGATLAELPAGAVVGTGSPRRAALVRSLRPDLAVEGVRGNVGTRIRKMHEGQYDALVLAAAGLVRLGREDEATERLDPMTFIPAVGQGAIALQARSDDGELLGMLSAVEHAATRWEVTAERAFLRAMGGGCRTPMACFGSVMNDYIRVVGMVASVDGMHSYRDFVAGEAREAEALGGKLAQTLLEQGASELLEEAGA